MPLTPFQCPPLLCVLALRHRKVDLRGQVPQIKPLLQLLTSGKIGIEPFPASCRTLRAKRSINLRSCSPNVRWESVLPLQSRQICIAVRVHNGIQSSQGNPIMRSLHWVAEDPHSRFPVFWPQCLHIARDNRYRVRDVGSRLSRQVEQGSYGARQGKGLVLSRLSLHALFFAEFLVSVPGVETCFRPLRCFAKS